MLGRGDISMLQAIRRWFAVRSYAKSLGPNLRERYGAQRKYTPAQVKRTIETCGYSTDYICYAMCIYGEYCDFTEYHLSNGESPDYCGMRTEVANWFFHGDASFDALNGIDRSRRLSGNDSAGGNEAWYDSTSDHGT